MFLALRHERHRCAQLMGDACLPLLGNSPRSIDAPMVARDMPRIAGHLTRQTVDATTLRRLLEDRHGVDTAEARERAQEDAGRIVYNQNKIPATTPRRALFDIAYSAEKIWRFDELLATSVIVE